MVSLSCLSFCTPRVKPKITSRCSKIFTRLWRKSWSVTISSKATELNPYELWLVDRIGGPCFPVSGRKLQMRRHIEVKATEQYLLVMLLIVL